MIKTADIRRRETLRQGRELRQQLYLARFAGQQAALVAPKTRTPGNMLAVRTIRVGK